MNGAYVDHTCLPDTNRESMCESCMKNTYVERAVTLGLLTCMQHRRPQAHSIKRHTNFHRCSPRRSDATGSAAPTVAPQEQEHVRQMKKLRPQNQSAEQLEQQKNFQFKNAIAILNRPLRE